MKQEVETGVFTSPSGLIRLDIPRAGTNLRELFDAKVAAGELTQIPDDSVHEVTEVYGRDKDGREQSLTRLELVDPPLTGAEKRASLGNLDPHDPPRIKRRPGRPTKAEKLAERQAAAAAELEQAKLAADARAAEQAELEAALANPADDDDLEDELDDDAEATTDENLEADDDLDDDDEIADLEAELALLEAEEAAADDSAAEPE